MFALRKYTEIIYSIYSIVKKWKKLLMRCCHSIRNTLQRCSLLEYRIDSIKCTYILTTIPSFCSLIPSKIESTYER